MLQPSVRAAAWFDALAQDVRLALRSFRLDPTFAIAAAATLALGIAASTSVMSIVDATLLRPLPFPSPDRVVYVTGVNPVRTAPSASDRSGRRPSARWAGAGIPRTLSDALRGSPAFESVSEFASWVSQPYTLAWADGTRVVNGVNVSPDFFTVFRVRPARGRVFTAADERVATPEVCILTTTGVRRLFNGQRDVIGKTVSFVEGQVTVVGVMSEEFWYPMPPDITMGQGETAPDLLVPWARFSERERPGQGRGYGVAARLQPGATVVQAQREATELALRYGEPSRDGGRDTARVRLLQEELALDARSTLLVLFGLIGCLLVVCCVNIGNLLVSRSQSRIRELAVRATLGATRTRLFRQLLTEYCVLAAASGAIGLLLSAAALNTFVSLLPAGLLLVPAIRVDLRMVGIAGIVTAFTALLSGLGPAVLATRADVSSALKAGGQSVARAPRWRRFAGTMVVVETSVLLVVLIGGALLVNSLLRLTTIDLGFAPDRVWTVDFVAPRSLYPQREQVGPLAARMADALRRIPGAVSVGASDWGPLRGVIDDIRMTIDGRSETLRSEVRHVSADYFQAVGISVRSGRLWTAADEDTAPKVAVINETAARRYWPGEDPIGRRITVSPGRTWRLEIVGVVSDLREATERRAPAPSVYVPMNPSSCLFYNFRTLVIRTSQPRTGVGRDAARAMAAVDSRLPVTATRADEALANGRRGPRFYAVFVGMAGAFGLLLVAVGIAGVTAHGVTRRTREIGVRLALGANPVAVVGMVVRQVVAPVLVGLGVGLSAGLAVSRVLTSFLYEITPQDPVTHVAASSLLLAVALLASWLPARRAARVRPADALRAE